MRKRIGMLYYPKLGHGGVESHLISLIHHLPESLYEIFIISDVAPEFAAHCNTPNVHIIDWKVSNILNPQNYFKLIKILKQLKLDILHIHNPAIALPVRIIAFIFGIPTISTIHLPLKDYFYTPGSKFRLKLQLLQHVETAQNYLFPHFLIFVSRQNYDEYLRQKYSPPDKMRWIPNSIPLEKFSPATNRPIPTYIKNKNEVIISSTSRLEFQKGLDILIDGLCLLDKTNPAFHVYIAGEGSQRKELTELLEKNHLAEKVSLVGFIEDTPALLNASDIFILTSRFETMPISLIEATATGLPIIATNAGDVQEIVKDNYNGFLIPKDNPIMVAEKLSVLLQSPETRKRMSNNSLEIAKKFDERNTVQKLVALYQSIVD